MRHFILIASFLFLAFGCAKQSGSSSTTTPATTYQLSGGLCYSSTGQQVASNYCGSTTTNGYQLISPNNCISTTTNQQVPVSYCSAGGTGYVSNSGYYFANGGCYSTSTNQQVPQNYCTNNGSGGTTGNGQQCYGMFYDPQSQRQGQCNGQNCAGYTLLSLTTNTYVNCL